MKMGPGTGRFTIGYLDLGANVENSAIWWAARISPVRPHRREIEAINRMATHPMPWLENRPDRPRGIDLNRLGPLQRGGTATLPSAAGQPLQQ